MVDGEKYIEDPRKKRGFVEKVQTVGAALAAAIASAYGVQKVTDLFKDEHLSKVKDAFKAFDSVRKVVKSQFGTGLFGFDIKDETNATRARSVLCKRQDGLGKCQVVNSWLAQLNKGDISKFNQMVAEQFVDMLTMYTILLEQVSADKSGQISPSNNQVPVSNLPAAEGIKFLIDMVKKSEEVMAQLDKSAADVLEMYADLPDDKARTDALIAAHLKRPELSIDDQEFIDESQVMLEDAKSRYHASVERRQQAYKTKRR